MDNNYNNTEANASALENKTIIYHENATGDLAYPSSNPTNQEKNLPAIVMIHEIKGLNDYIKDSADILAQHGYVVWQLIFFKGISPQIKIVRGN